MPLRSSLIGWRLKVEKLHQANAGSAFNSANYRGVSACWEVKESGGFRGVRRGEPVLHDVGCAGVVLPIIIAGNGRAVAVIDSKHRITQRSRDSRRGQRWSDRADDDCVTRDIPNNEPADQNVVARANRATGTKIRQLGIGQGRKIVDLDQTDAWHEIFSGDYECIGARRQGLNSR